VLKIAETNTSSRLCPYRYLLHVFDFHVVAGVPPDAFFTIAPTQLKAPNWP